VSVGGVPRRGDPGSVAFSVLMAIYAGDRPEQLRAALASLLQSTVRPDQVVLVQDGPVAQDLIDVVEAFTPELRIERIVLPVNHGLGLALRKGLQACRHEWVARFDADDLVLPERFEQQLAFVQTHGDTDVLGGWIAEFDHDPAESTGLRKVPLSPREIAHRARTRNPMNHMTVMFRQSSVWAAGGYHDEKGFEDYALWARMLVNGATLRNLPVVLVKARAGASMMARRGGWRYVRTEWALQRALFRIGFVGLFRMVCNLVLRMPVRMMPQGLRATIYRVVLRKKNGTSK